MDNLSLKNNKSERNTSIEILRILSMLLIITSHYSVHGGFDKAADSLNLNNMIVQMLSLGGKLGTNCFIIITGYFIIDSKFKVQKLIKLILEIVFYSILFFVIFCFVGEDGISAKAFAKALFPITYNVNWFASTYVVFYIFSPFISKFIKALDRKAHKNIIIIATLVWCIIPTIFRSSAASSNLSWFVTIYLIASYIKYYPSKYTSKIRLNVIISLIIAVMLIAAVPIFNILGLRLSILKVFSTGFSGLNQLPTLLLSITLFLIFKNAKIRTNRFINAIAITTFGIYLIHENVYVRPFLWIKLFKNATYMDSPLLILHAMGSVFIVFIMCVAIDYIRIMLIEKPLFNLIENNQSKINALLYPFNKSFANMINRLSRILNK